MKSLSVYLSETISDVLYILLNIQVDVPLMVKDDVKLEFLYVLPDYNIKHLSESVKYQFLEASVPQNKAIEIIVDKRLSNPPADGADYEFTYCGPYCYTTDLGHYVVGDIHARRLTEGHYNFELRMGYIFTPL